VSNKLFYFSENIKIGKNTYDKISIYNYVQTGIKLEADPLKYSVQTVTSNISNKQKRQILFYDLQNPKTTIFEILLEDLNIESKKDSLLMYLFDIFKSNTQDLVDKDRERKYEDPPVSVSDGERPYDLITSAKRLPSYVKTKNQKGEEVIIHIIYGTGFESDNYHTPDNWIADYAIQGYIEGLKQCNLKGANITEITINCTTNGTHSTKDKPYPNWNRASSNHYIRNGADAIDTGKINGVRPSIGNKTTLLFLQTFNSLGNINEVFGPDFNYKKGAKIQNQYHDTWIHTSFSN
jgi:hypothetical protein